MTKIAADGLDAGIRKVIVTETIVRPSKAFDINDFSAFLVKRGTKSFDPVSGILKLGSQEVCVSQDGAVEGPESLRLRVEKWIEAFMSS